MTARPRLTPHQREVLGRIEWMARNRPAGVPAEWVRSAGAIAHLQEKGYITVTETTSGPRGGRRFLVLPR